MYPSVHDIQVSNYPSIQKKSVSKISMYSDIWKKWYPLVPTKHVMFQETVNALVAHNKGSQIRRFVISFKQQFSLIKNINISAYTLESNGYIFIQNACSSISWNFWDIFLVPVSLFVFTRVHGLAVGWSPTYPVFFCSQPRFIRL